MLPLRTRAVTKSSWCHRRPCADQRVSVLTGSSSLFYLAAAVALGAGFLYWSVKLVHRPEPSTAMDTFKYSIVYLALIFIALVVDHYLF